MLSIDLEAWQGLGQTYKHGRHSIFYADRGRGEKLLLIHGFPTASWDWHKQWPELVARYRCIAPDMIGFGFSAKPRLHNYRIMDQADLHEGLLAQLEVERVHILAHDYGDTVAQELLARDIDRRAQGLPGRIQSVCFLNGGLFPETHHARPIQKLLLGPLGWLIVRLLKENSFRQNIRQVFGPETPPTDEELAAFWALASRNKGTRIYHKLIRYMEDRREHRERWVGALQKSPVPLRVIVGMADPVSGAHMLARYNELVPNADAVPLDCGHWPQIERAQEMLSVYLDWRKSRETSA